MNTEKKTATQRNISK